MIHLNQHDVNALVEALQVSHDLVESCPELAEVSKGDAILSLTTNLMSARNADYTARTIEEAVFRIINQ